MIGHRLGKMGILFILGIFIFESGAGSLCGVKSTGECHAAKGGAAEMLAPSSIFSFDTAKKSHVERLDRGRKIVHRIWDNTVNGYDVRGITEGPDATMTPDLAYTLGIGMALRLCARMPERRPRVLVTGDHRASTPFLFSGLMEGLTRGGVDVSYSDETVSTPASNIVSRQPGQDYDGVVQITASHTPWTRPAPKNGFKVSLKDGDGYLRAIYGNAMANMLDEGVSEQAHVLRPQNEWGGVNQVDVLPLYYDCLEKRFDGLTRRLNLTREDKENVILVVDPGNAVMGPIARNAAEKLGLQYAGIHDEVMGGVDARPAHPSDPNLREYYEEHLPQVVRQVQAEHPGKIVLGIALDGDGDRLGMTDEGGHQYLTYPQMAYFFHTARAQEDPRAPVILDIRSPQEIAELSSETPNYFSPGAPIVREEMRRARANVAVEGSYHVFMPVAEDPNVDPIDDGLWAGLYAAAQAVHLAKQNASIHAMIDRPWYPSLPQELRPAIGPGTDRMVLMSRITSGLRHVLSRAFPGSTIRQIRLAREPNCARFQVRDGAGQFKASLVVRAAKSENNILSVFAQGGDEQALQTLTGVLSMILSSNPEVDQRPVRQLLLRMLAKQAPFEFLSEQGVFKPLFQKIPEASGEMVRPAHRPAAPAERPVEDVTPVDALTAVEFRGLFLNGYRSGAIKRVSQFKEWKDLQSDKKKVLAASVIPMRKINGQWCFLLAQRNPERAADCLSEFAAYAGGVDYDFDPKIDTPDQIKSRMDLGIMAEEDLDSAGKRESVACAAVRELNEESHIKLAISDLHGRTDDFRGEHEGILGSCFINISDSEDPHVDETDEMINPQWVPISVLMSCSPDDAGSAVEKYLQTSVPGCNLTNTFRTAGMKNLHVLLSKVIAVAEEFPPQKIPDGFTPRPLQIPDRDGALMGSAA